MIRFGVLLVVLGFGSVLFHYTDYQFRVLMWAEDMQPALGSAVGVAGLLLSGAAVLRKQRAGASPGTVSTGSGPFPAQQPPLPPQGHYGAPAYTQQPYPNQPYPQQPYPQQPYGQQPYNGQPGYPPPHQSFGPQS
jgi:hypothetical protein